MRPISELSEALTPRVPVSKKMKRTGGKREVVEYIDVPLCFDCETYSFTIVNEEGEREKRAIMWAWGLAVGDECYMGRTWPEFVDAVHLIARAWETGPRRRAVIWVHNLSYDFSYFRKWLEWDNIFPLSSRTPCYVLEKCGVEFRCSYILTGYSLEKVGEHLMRHDIKKLSGTIDYTVARHPGTKLTREEVEYLEHDCLVVTAHIQEQIEDEGGMAHMPLTKTGYVRRDVRNRCFRDPTKKASADYSRIRYMEFMRGLTMDGFIYDSLRRAFQGGFTHASPYHACDTLESVSSYDFASAYPAVMCSELFPVGPPEIWMSKDEREIEETLRLYCCVFTVRLVNVRPRVNYDHYLSGSHCDIPEGTKRQLSNGRIVSADELTTTITEVDWKIIKRCYIWDGYEISGLIRWRKGYLPKPIIESVIGYFQEKTKLKGVKGKEAEYMSAKENLNSIYGMMVTDPVRPLIPYDLENNEWGELVDGTIKVEKALSPKEKEKALDDYNDSKSRFTYYAWGVYITAYCRKNLWRGIFHFAEDYAYSDTDSLKVLRGLSPEHKAYIDEYNALIQDKVKECLAWSGMDPALSVAKAPDGKEKALGVWEYEGTYTRFKTLGAKRYMVEEQNKKTGGRFISITVSGVNKREAVPYIFAQTAGPMRTGPEGGGDPFEFFCHGMVIPPGHCGKMIPTYGDMPIKGKIRDRDGVVYEYEELSFCYMEPGGYSMGPAEGYVLYLDMLKKGMLS